MTKATSRFSLAVGVAMLAGTVVLAGCGAPPTVTRTSSTEQTTTTTPAPVVATTTTTTQQTRQP